MSALGLSGGWDIPTYRANSKPEVGVESGPHLALTLTLTTMTPEERLLLTIQKLHSQVYENPEEIKELCLTAIEQYGNERYDEGYRLYLKQSTNSASSI